MAQQQLEHLSPASEHAEFIPRSANTGTPSMPNDYQSQVAFIREHRKDVVREIAIILRSRKQDNRVAKLYNRLDSFLPWLATQVIITPMMKKDALVEDMLQIMFDGKVCEFPERYANQARSLYERWQAERWGVNNAVPCDSLAVLQGGATLAVARTGTPLVPDDHPIWGKNGIMYGAMLTIKANGKTETGLRNDLVKRNFRVHGHNNLTVGQWWPLQKLAWMYGGHGSHIAGISGDAESGGAYSIVLSRGAYEGLDKDLGDIIYYSGSGSQSNTNPLQPAESTDGTKWLKTSIATQNPVRVFRSAGQQGSDFVPCGIRYDGLYNVEQLLRPLNNAGGLFEQFKLVRQPDQIALSDIKTQQRNSSESIAISGEATKPLKSALPTARELQLLRSRENEGMRHDECYTKPC